MATKKDKDKKKNSSLVADYLDSKGKTSKEDTNSTSLESGTTEDTGNENTGAATTPIDEPVLTFEPMTNITEESELNTPVEDNQGSEGQNPLFEESQVSENNKQEVSNDGKPQNNSQEQDDEDFGMKQGRHLKDLPPKLKKKALVKTAKALAKVYSKVLPILPKQFAKVSESKLMVMQMNDEVKLDFELHLEGGSTITLLEFVKSNNRTADQTLFVTSEMEQEFETAIYDVLEEKEVALTPMDRLLIVVGEHLTTMVTASIQIGMQTKMILAESKKWYESLKKERPPSQPPPPKHTQEPSQDHQKTSNVNTEAKPQNTDVITIEPESLEEK